MSTKKSALKPSTKIIALLTTLTFIFAIYVGLLRVAEAMWLAVSGNPYPRDTTPLNIEVAAFIISMIIFRFLIKNLLEWLKRKMERLISERVKLAKFKADRKARQMAVKATNQPDQ